MKNTRDTNNPTSLSTQMDRLFCRMTLGEWFRRIRTGLRRPEDTAESRYARSEVKRLFAPLLALLVPMLVTLLLVLISQHRGGSVIDDGIVVTREPDRTEEPLDKPPELEPADVLEMMTPDIASVSDSPVQSDVEIIIAAHTPTPPMQVIPKRYSPLSIRLPIATSGLAKHRQVGKAEMLRKYGADPRTEPAILRALRWLKSEKQPDGSWNKPKAAHMVGLEDEQLESSLDNSGNRNQQERLA